MLDIIHSSTNYQVRTIVVSEERPWVVTFSSRNVKYDNPRKRDFKRSFATKALADLRINCIEFVTNKNDWYQSEGADRAVNAIVDFLPPDSRVFTYGSSMGGFAAINFSALLGASAFIAISPQFSIRRDVMSDLCDTRWEGGMAAENCRFDLTASGANRAVKGIVAYDDFHVNDHNHALRIAASTDCVLLPVSYAGHPVGPAINSMYGLKNLISGVVGGACDFSQISREIKFLNDRSLHFIASDPSRIDEFLETYISHPSALSLCAVENLFSSLDKTIDSGSLKKVLFVVFNILLSRKDVFAKREVYRRKLLKKVRGAMVEIGIYFSDSCK